MIVYKFYQFYVLIFYIMLVLLSIIFILYYFNTKIWMNRFIEYVEFTKKKNL